MRKVLVTIILLTFACGSEQQPPVHHNRFLESMKSAKQVADIRELTNDDRCVYPLFAPGDSIIYFERLLVSESEDTLGRSPEELIKPYGLRLSDMELLTLSEEYSYPEREFYPQDSLPVRTGERVIQALISPDSQIVAYETVIGSLRDSRTVYLARGDSTIQLTYGDTPCFLDRFSNTGRYLTVICGYGPSWIVIFDLRDGTSYRIYHEGDLIDYMTSFSSDDTRMLFIRSDKKYSVEYDFLGDIWLLKFRK